MHRLVLFSGILGLTLLMAACIEPGNYRMRDRYVVTSRTLYMRSAPSTVSEILGSFRLGDTLIAAASDRYWIMIRDGAVTGYVSTDFLKKIEYPITPTFFEFIEKLANLKTWLFWVLAVTLLLVWGIVEESILKFKQRLRKRYGVNIKEILIIPVVFFVSAVISGLIYLYWKDYLIESLAARFSVDYMQTNLVTIAIWVQLAVMIIATLFDFLGSIFKSGIRRGFLLTVFDAFWGVLIFAITFFLTMGLSFYAIAFMVVFFTVRYIHVVYQNDLNFKRYR